MKKYTKPELRELAEDYILDGADPWEQGNRRKVMEEFLNGL